MRRITLWLAVFAVGYCIGFLWHRAKLPPAGLGLADGTAPHAITQAVVASRRDLGIVEVVRLFDAYPAAPFDIVMFGDSLTAGAQWNELLGRQLVANRGVGSDRLVDFERRRASVLKLTPKLVVVQGGINDLRGGLAPSEVVAGCRRLLETLRDHRVAVVLQSVVFTHLPELNDKVADLNERLSALASELDVGFVDLNRGLAKNGFVQPALTLDGIHLNAAGYQAWAEILRPHLDRVGL